MTPEGSPKHMIVCAPSSMPVEVKNLLRSQGLPVIVSEICPPGAVWLLPAEYAEQLWTDLLGLVTDLGAALYSVSLRDNSTDSDEPDRRTSTAPESATTKPDEGTANDSILEFPLGPFGTRRSEPSRQERSHGED